MKLTEIKVLVFEYKDGFMVDVVETSDCYEAWIYHKDYGIKMMMFGLPKDVTNLQQALPIIEANLANQNFVEDYMDEYMD